MKVVDFIRTVPGGVPVTTNTPVAIKKEIDGSLITTVYTDATGRFVYEANGHPGPYRYETTAAGNTKTHSSKSLGYAGPISLGELYEYFRVWNDGVIQGVGSELAVTSAGTNMTVTVAQGSALVRGLLYRMVSASLPVTLTGANGANPRNDLIVVEVYRAGHAEEGRAFLTYVTGAPAVSPVDPALTQTTDRWQIAIARVRVDTGVTAIASTGKITSLLTYSTPFIPTGSITSAMLLDGTIVNADIAGATITGAKLVNDTVTATQIAANAVTESELAPLAVATGHLAALAVTGAKIADGTITGDKIDTDTIAAINIAPNAVGASEIVDGSVGTAELATAAVTAIKIAAGAVGTTEIAAGGVGTTNIALLAVASARIADGAVTAAKLNQMGATTGQLIGWSGTAWAPTSPAGVGAGSITTTEIANNTILNADISASAAIAGGKLAALSVGSAQIAADAITASELAPSAVSNSHVSASAAIHLSKLGQSGATTNQVVKWNGSAWAPAADASGAATLTALDDLFFAKTDSADDADVSSTTNISTPVVGNGYQKTYTLPPGTWTCLVIGNIALRRDVASGNVTVTCTVDGTTGGLKYGAIAGSANDPTTMSVSNTKAGVIGLFSYSINYCGQGTAGTTFADNPMLTLIAYRTA